MKGGEGEDSAPARTVLYFAFRPVALPLCPGPVHLRLGEAVMPKLGDFLGYQPSLVHDLYGV
ncbi:MAG: hypothetical protein IIA23_09735 [Chloroflexi bacterium]|nr:hypothetical protein [Chloroflexota bacterium]